MADRGKPKRGFTASEQWSSMTGSVGAWNKGLLPRCLSSKAVFCHGAAWWTAARCRKRLNLKANVAENKQMVKVLKEDLKSLKRL